MGRSTLSWWQLPIACCPGRGQCLTRGESSGPLREQAERVTLDAWIRVAESGLLWGQVSGVGREVLMVDLLGVYCVYKDFCSQELGVSVGQ